MTIIIGTDKTFWGRKVFIRILKRGAHHDKINGARREAYVPEIITAQATAS
jgi:hypothetical protein